MDILGRIRPRCVVKTHSRYECVIKPRAAYKILAKITTTTHSFFTIPSFALCGIRTPFSDIIPPHSTLIVDTLRRNQTSPSNTGTSQPPSRMRWYPFSPHHIFRADFWRSLPELDLGRAGDSNDGVRRHMH